MFSEGLGKPGEWSDSRQGLILLLAFLNTYGEVKAPASNGGSGFRLAYSLLP